MPAGKPKKTKVIKGTKLAVRRAKDFADKTGDRISKGLEAVWKDKYSLSDFADDVVNQWSDFFKVMNRFSGSTDDQVSTAYLVTGPWAPPPAPLPPVPAPEWVELTDSTQAPQIEWTDLVGPVTIVGGVTTINVIPKANYEVWDPMTDAVPVVQAPPLPPLELDSVKIRIINFPAQVPPGIYQGAITLQSTKILARVVFLMK